MHKTNRWLRESLSVSGQLALLTVASSVMGLMFSALQSIGIAWLRVALSSLIAVGVLLVYALEGRSRGMRDVAASRYAAALLEKGEALTPKEERRCYQPLKAVVGSTLVFAMPLVLAIYIAATAQPVLTGDVARAVPGMRDWLRAIVRLFELPYINLFSTPADAAVLIDRLSAVWIAGYPLAYVAGYLCGPAADRRMQERIRRAKRAAVRRERKDHLAARLTGDVNAPHYGHRPDSEKPRRKQLL